MRKRKKKKKRKRKRKRKKRKRKKKKTKRGNSLGIGVCLIGKRRRVLSVKSQGRPIGEALKRGEISFTATRIRLLITIAAAL